jgi:hypothetical protein
LGHFARNCPSSQENVNKARDLIRGQQREERHVAVNVLNNGQLEIIHVSDLGDEMVQILENC